MSTKNLIKKENKFQKEYFAKVVSNDDPLSRGRLLVTVETLMGKIPFWTNCTNQIGKVNLQLIPEPEDTVTVKFKNKDIYSGEWELKGSPVDGTEEKKIDPKKYGLYDEQGNCIIIDRATNNIIITAKNNCNVTINGITNIVCPTVNITGNLHVTGTIVSDTEVTNSAKGVSLGTHVHPYTWTDGAGSGNTSPGQG